MKHSIRMASLSAALVLGACAHGVPLPSNVGFVYDPARSACRADGGPNDSCVSKDLVRCKTLIDYANPGRDEATYTGIVTGLTGLAGTLIGYDAAGITGQAFENTAKVVTGSYAGGGLGTALTYVSPLYRGSIESCMSSYGRDPHLTEQYLGSVAYTSKVESLDSVTGGNLVVNGGPVYGNQPPAQAPQYMQHR